ncbi:phospholipase D-like domain-containing protein [Psychrobacillus sp. FSL W7-1493]|uniref:phospholipase D-like domain-containing protein n=1 Tax=Psychrobacillus sp. FSL W7-1493 TaxID=2921552 RepID=UPI0030FA92BD
MTQKILHSKEIMPFLKDELGRISNQLIIVSAYVKIEALKELDKYLTNIEKILLVRFRKGDILSNSTDIELYDYCVSNGWKMYFNFDMHSKIYVFDRQTFFIGSANATLSGLGIKEHSNIESGVTGTCDELTYTKILEVFNNAIQMTPSLMIEFQNQIIEQPRNNTFQEWFLNDLNLAKSNSIKNLWVCDFISSTNTFDIKSKDLKLLGLTREESYDTKRLRDNFKALKCYNWLINIIEEEIYFGELSATLHNALIDDPTPYRKEVKDLLAILLIWIQELDIEEIIIDRPKYSQRIKKNIKLF